MNTFIFNESGLQVLTSNPEEYHLWSYLAGIARVTALTPVVYQGAIAGSEFLTYAATKMYLALDFDAAYTSGAVGAAAGSVVFYNIANAIDFYYINAMPIWNGAAAQYSNNNVNKKLILFSRVVFNVYTYIHFVGYRITRA